MKQQDSIIDEHRRTIGEFNKKITQLQKAKEHFSEYDDDILSLSLEDILNQEQVETTRSWQQTHLTQKMDRLTTSIEDLVKESMKVPKQIACEWCGDLVETKVNANFI